MAAEEEEEEAGGGGIKGGELTFIFIFAIELLLVGSSILYDYFLTIVCGMYVQCM